MTGIWWNYRRRKRLGFVRVTKPRRLADPAKRAEVAQRYLRREKTQLELALEYDVSQPTISRCIANYDPMRSPAGHARTEATGEKATTRHTTGRTDPKIAVTRLNEVLLVTSAAVEVDKN